MVRRCQGIGRQQLGAILALLFCSTIKCIEATPEFAAPRISQQLTGRLSLPPQGGLRLEGSDMSEYLATDLWRVQIIDFAALTAAIGVELLPIILLLDGNAPYGFVRAWTPPAIDENWHLGYAFPPWFALAVTLVVALVLTLRRDKAGTP